MTTAPAAQTPEPPDDGNIDFAFEKQLEALETTARTAMISLKTETDHAQGILSDIEQRVTMGQMGAEIVKPLRDAVKDARDTIKDLEQAANQISQQRENLK